jgi:hypothetical protein
MKPPLLLHFPSTLIFPHGSYMDIIYVLFFETFFKFNFFIGDFEKISKGLLSFLFKRSVRTQSNQSSLYHVTNLGRVSHISFFPSCGKSFFHKCLFRTVKHISGCNTTVVIQFLESTKYLLAPNRLNERKCKYWLEF